MIVAYETTQPALAHDLSEPVASTQESLSVSELPADFRGGEFPPEYFVDPASGDARYIRVLQRLMSGNTLAMGPPGTGKVRKIVIPWIVAGTKAGASVLVLARRPDLISTVKSELATETLTSELRTIEVNLTGPKTAHWDWIADLRTDAAIERAVVAILGPRPPSDANPYFYLRDSRNLRGLLELAIGLRDSGHTALDVLEWTTNKQTLAEAIRISGSPPSILTELSALGESEFDREMVRLSARLSPLVSVDRPGIESTREYSGTSGEITRLFKEQTLIHLVVPSTDVAPAGPMASMFIGSMLEKAREYFMDPETRPMILVIDDAPWLQAHMDLVQMLDISRAAQVSVVFTIQGPSQFHANSRESVISRFKTIVLFPGPLADSANQLLDIGAVEYRSDSVDDQQWMTQVKDPTARRLLPSMVTSTRSPNQEPERTSGATSTVTVYEALGAEVGISKAVDDFYERVVADPDLAEYFTGVDMVSLRRHQTEMLVAATGGPAPYTGEDMHEAHVGLKITDAAFDKVVGHLGATLVAAGASDDTIGAVVAALSPLRSAIVSL